MKLAEYQKMLKKPLRPRTLCFLMKKDQVLLGYKKKGFGKGNWLGIGGKVEAGENISDAACREVVEEIKVTVVTLKQYATINFYFPHVPDESWNQQVNIFICTAWTGEPQETDEMRPQWFGKHELPLASMWDDAQYWLPQLLEKKHFTADFIFNQNLRVTDHVLKYA